MPPIASSLPCFAISFSSVTTSIGLRRGLEVADRLEHDLVLVVVEVLDLERLELDQHVVAQDHAAEDRRLGIEVVRQHSAVARHRHTLHNPSVTPATVQRAK